MSHVFSGFKSALLEAFFSGADVRAKLLMSNTTADTDVDAKFVADIGTLDEFDGAGYAEAVLAGEAVTLDAAANRGEFTGNPFNFGTTVSAGTRQAVGMLVYKRVSADPAANIVVSWYDGTPFPFTPSGGPVNVTPNAEGMLQAT